MVLIGVAPCFGRGNSRAATFVVVFEKTGPQGERGVVPIGIGLMAFGALVMLHPGWLPGPVAFG